MWRLLWFTDAVITSELFGFATWEASSTAYLLLVPLVHISSVGRGTNGIGSHCFKLRAVPQWRLIKH
ncbi:hypothetical protein DY000_02063903 [Brassica cretica]|uniref:Secreted protein n=1 Tax=Brassica cretica TaxID=69181 RepID=A0ABQ7AX55_BRACR|nr:hypothetical protein DY000_02063903 [Brassica cretica]